VESCSKFRVFVFKIVGSHSLLHHIIVKTLAFLLDDSGSKLDNFSFHSDSLRAERNNLSTSISINVDRVAACDAVLATHIVFRFSARCSRPFPCSSGGQLRRLIEIVSATLV
jgi:hypothetical protein